LIGDEQGQAVFTYTSAMALNLMKAMLLMDLSEVDELVCTALQETTNIISGKASTFIAASGKKSDIGTPKVISDLLTPEQGSGFYVDTELGCVAISIFIE
jgi:CheY-specific phosphatase CheX